jgi:isopenicillin N synthase-like dioxygenase
MLSLTNKSLMIQIPTYINKFSYHCQIHELSSDIYYQIEKSATSYGFFQLVKHGISETFLDSRGDVAVTSNLYTIDRSRKVRYFSNSRLYKSVFANWQDLQVCDFDGSLDVNDIPIGEILLPFFYYFFSYDHI